MHSEVYKSVRLKFVRVDQLEFDKSLFPRVKEVCTAQMPALKRADLLTDDAKLLYLFLSPICVLKRSKSFLIVSNFRSAEIAKTMSKLEKVPVLIVTLSKDTDHDQFGLSCHFLKSIVDAFDLKYEQQSVLRIWDQLTEDEIADISPFLSSRMGLETYIGINRRQKISKRNYAESPAMSCKKRSASDAK